MFLSDQTIKKFIAEEKIIVDPPVRDADIRAVGIRAHLAEEILVPESGQKIDLAQPVELRYKKVNISYEKFVLNPGEFILGSTIERIKISRKLIAFIDGRSTIARLGLTVHLSSATIDGNYDELRAVTLEISNTGSFRITLAPKYPVGMFTFSLVEGFVEQKPQSQYSGQVGVAAPNLEYKTGKDI